MSAIKNSSRPVRPFVRWVGGKRIIAHQLMKYLPATKMNNYYEPFLGGGALFFQVKHLFKKCYLSDINLDLITSFNAVKQNPEQVGKLLRHHVQNHCRQYYYQIRGINNSNNPEVISARFLYLNRYSFNGIYCVNRNGRPDLTLSYKKRAELNLEKKLQQCSSFLSGTLIYATDFSFIDPLVDDFVYFDPPYHQAGEKFYTKPPFDENDQTRLRDFAKKLDNKGVRFMLSNSNTEFIRDLYQGFNINVIEVKYTISGSKQELVITNYLLLYLQIL